MLLASTPVDGMAGARRVPPRRRRRDPDWAAAVETARPEPQPAAAAGMMWSPPPCTPRASLAPSQLVFASPWRTAQCEPELMKPPQARMSVAHQVFRREAGIGLRRGPPSLPRVLMQFSCSADNVHHVSDRDMDDVPPYAVHFARQRPILGIADESGLVSLLPAGAGAGVGTGTRDGNEDRDPALVEVAPSVAENSVARWEAHTNVIFDFCWADNDTRLITASGDQSCRVWDVERTTMLAQFVGHSGSVKSVRCCRNNPSVFATAARGGSVHIYDLRDESSIVVTAGTSSSSSPSSLAPAGDNAATTVRPLHSLARLHIPPPTLVHRSKRRRIASPTVTAVQFLADDTMLATSGDMDGCVKLWDARKFNRMSKCLDQPQPLLVLPTSTEAGRRNRGIAALDVDASGGRLLTVCTDGCVNVYATANPDAGIQASLRGASVNFFSRAAFSPSGRYVLCGSTDHDAYIWDCTAPTEPPLRLAGHIGDVTAVAWSPIDPGCIATGSDDCSVRVWTMDRSTPLASEPSPNPLLGVSLRPHASLTSPLPLRSAALTAGNRTRGINNNSNIRNDGGDDDDDDDGDDDDDDDDSSPMPSAPTSPARRAHPSPGRLISSPIRYPLRDTRLIVTPERDSAASLPSSAERTRSSPAWSPSPRVARALMPQPGQRTIHAYFARQDS